MLLSKAFVSTFSPHARDPSIITCQTNAKYISVHKVSWVSVIGASVVGASVAGISVTSVSVASVLVAGGWWRLLTAGHSYIPAGYRRLFDYIGRSLRLASIAFVNIETS